LQKLDDYERVHAHTSAMKRTLKKSLTGDEHLAFIKQCESYIRILQSENKLISAQPIVREGVVISKSGSDWAQRDIANDTQVQVGYYHIRANDMEEAIAK
jgi:hypothetical protein